MAEAAPVDVRAPATSPGTVATARKVHTAMGTTWLKALAMLLMTSPSILLECTTHQTGRRSVCTAHIYPVLHFPKLYVY